MLSYLVAEVFLGRPSRIRTLRLLQLFNEIIFNAGVTLSFLREHAGQAFAFDLNWIDVSFRERVRRRHRRQRLWAVGFLHSDSFVVLGYGRDSARSWGVALALSEASSYRVASEAGLLRFGVSGLVTCRSSRRSQRLLSCASAESQGWFCNWVNHSTVGAPASTKLCVGAFFL